MATAQYIAETLGLLAVAFVGTYFAARTFACLVFPKPAHPEPSEKETDWGSQ